MFEAYLTEAQRDPKTGRYMKAAPAGGNQPAAAPAAPDAAAAPTAPAPVKPGAPVAGSTTPAGATPAPAAGAVSQPNQGEVAQGPTAETQDTTNQNTAQTDQATPNAAAGAQAPQADAAQQMNQMVDFVMKSATSTPATAQALIKLLQADKDLWPKVQQAMMTDADFSQKLFQQFGQAMQASAPAPPPNPAIAAQAASDTQAGAVGAAYGV
jgi:hypothetical protein